MNVYSNVSGNLPLRFRGAKLQKNPQLLCNIIRKSFVSLFIFLKIPPLLGSYSSISDGKMTSKIDVFRQKRAE